MGGNTGINQASNFNIQTIDQTFYQKGFPINFDIKEMEVDSQSINFLS